MKRVLVGLPDELLMAAEKQAQIEFCSRSNLLRRALVEYLRSVPGAQDEELITDPEELARIIRERKLRISIRQILKDMKRNR